MSNVRGLPVREQGEDRARWNKALGVAILAGLLAIGLFSMFRPKASAPLVVQEGTEYKLLSYATAETPVADQPVPTYVFNIGWQTDDMTAMHHGSIMVPKIAARIDDQLAENTVVWDSKISIEGREYQIVRWNPSYSLRAKERPLVSANERPLTR